MRIRLSDEDRARLNCPEWLEYTPKQITVTEAAQLEEAGGSVVNYRLGGALGIRDRVWVALHRLGIAPATVADLNDLNLGDIGWEVPEVDEGKAPSASAARRTRSRSTR